MFQRQTTMSYAAMFLLFSTFTHAIPWPQFLPDIDALVVRQNSAASSSASTAIQTSVPISTATASADNSASGSVSITASATASIISSTAASTASKTVYDPRLPAGGISMMTPAVTSGVQYYRVGENVTFAWNYTSLSATPSYINIMASCSLNKELYTIATSQPVSATGNVTWDTGVYQTVPFPVASYTLVIYDAAAAITAAPAAGYLGTYNQYTFGMYTPQPYQDLNSFQCATCSGALSGLERQALGFVFGMATITVLSFTWFVNGLDVIW